MRDWLRENATIPETRLQEYAGRFVYVVTTGSEGVFVFVLTFLSFFLYLDEVVVGYFVFHSGGSSLVV